MTLTACALTSDLRSLTTSICRPPMMWLRISDIATSSHKLAPSLDFGASDVANKF